MCMARTNIDIDERACALVMKRFGLRTKREAVNTALQLAAIEPMSVEQARGMYGSGWDGDLEHMKAALGGP